MKNEVQYSEPCKSINSIITGKTISVVIPAYNEEKNIINTLVETLHVFDRLKCDYELIIVDDGSRDLTRNIVKKYLKNNKGRVKIEGYEHNTGKGFALRYGLNLTKGDYVLFLDADLDLHPSNIKNFLETLITNNADVVAGSKRNKDTLSDYPKIRKILSIFYYNLIKLLFRLPVRDTQTGFKLFKSAAIKDVIPRVTISRFAFDLELIVALNKKGYKIAECAVKLKPKGEHKRISLGDAFKVFFDTIIIFYRLYFKKIY